MSVILVVDDDPAIREIAGGFLAEAGYVVETAGSLAEARAAIAARAPDLLLVDIVLPDGCGTELTRAVRANPATADMAVICMTAHDDPDRRVQALEAGADEFLGKPFARVELLTRVRLLLSRRQYERELRAGLERIQRLEAARDDLVHMMVHDMGNVLAGAMGYLELALASRAAAPEELVRDVESARECIRMLQRMFSDVLDLRRLEEGRMPIERHVFSVGEVVEEVIDAMRGIAAARRKRLRAGELPPDLPRVEADRALVTRVIMNLVMNALKYAGKGSEVTVGAALGESPDRVAIHVDDEGPGIPPEVRARLFEKFVTGGPTARAAASTERGRGLGLAFCKAAIDAHGGAIRALAREPRGTRFVVELPVTFSVPAATARAEDA